jgi:prevent-host-death family protein
VKIVPVAEVKARLSAYLEASADGPVIVTKNGRPVAALVAVSDEDEIERLVLAYTPRFRRLLEEAEARIRRAGGVEHAEFWDAVG